MSVENSNYINRVKLVANLVAEYYEQGRQDRCLLWCYRHVVIKLYPMSKRTFWRYMRIAVKELGYNFKDRYL